MTLRPEMVLAKGTAGHQLTAGNAGDVRRMMSRPEFAIYLAGLYKEPLWLIQAIYAGDMSYGRRLAESLAVDIELSFEIKNVHNTTTDFKDLAAVLIAHYIGRGYCQDCKGTGCSKWHVVACGRCSGSGMTPLHDKEIADAANIPRSSYSRRRKKYSAIMDRLLTQLDGWHVEGISHVRDRIGEG